MKTLTEVLLQYSEMAIPILDDKITLSAYVPLDLSKENPLLQELDISIPEQCQEYINTVLKEKGGNVAYGGYLERRNLYSDKANFNEVNKASRNIHLGLDFWAPAHTPVITPLNGTVHSFGNNIREGDYGPTIILEHQLNNTFFFTLYGHLSMESLSGLYPGKKIMAQTVLGTLGTSDINGNYAPHLHFQIINDLEGNLGDYPGVCAPRDLDFYRINCPDPNLLLKIQRVSR